jgi:hypothetical protein
MTMQQGGRKIVPVFDTSFARVARAHAVATVIKDAAGQQRLRFHPGGHVIVHLLVQLGLDGIEYAPVENGGLLAFQDLTLEDHLSNVEAIAK